nr:unnamed protein product [Spirometra erinaceieuropaei]
MALFDHMRNRGRGIHRSIDTTSTSHKSTNVSMASPINSPSLGASNTSGTTAETDSTAPGPYCPHGHRTFTFHIDMVGPCESIARRPANQCLECQHTPDATASSAGIAFVHSVTT